MLQSNIQFISKDHKKKKINNDKKYIAEQRTLTLFFNYAITIQLTFCFMLNVYI